MQDEYHSPRSVSVILKSAIFVKFFVWSWTESYCVRFWRTLHFNRCTGVCVCMCDMFVIIDFIRQLLYGVLIYFEFFPTVEIVSSPQITQIKCSVPTFCQKFWIKPELSLFLYWGFLLRKKNHRIFLQFISIIKNLIYILGVDGWTILEWTLKRKVSMLGIELIRHRIGIAGEPLWMRHWTSGFHKPWS